jgi:hypothetical protein
LHRKEGSGEEFRAVSNQAAQGANQGGRQHLLPRCLVSFQPP